MIRVLDFDGCEVLRTPPGVDAYEFRIGDDKTGEWRAVRISAGLVDARGIGAVVRELAAALQSLQRGAVS